MSRQLAANFTLLSGGELIGKACTFIAFVYLARILGPQSFGSLELTLAIMVFLHLFVDLGSGPYGAREIAKDTEQVGILNGNTFALRLVRAAVGYLLLTVLVLSLPDTKASVRGLLMIYGLTLFAAAGFLQWVFQGLDQMKWVALGSVIRQLIFAVGVCALVRDADHLWVIGVVECVSVGGFVAFNFYIYRSCVRQLRLWPTPRTLKSDLAQALPIGLSELTWALTWYSVTILLGFLVGGKDVGWFAAAHRPVMTLHTFVWLYFFNLLPSMSRCAEQSQGTFQELVTGSIKVTAWLAIFLGSITLILAEPTMLLVFGREYLVAASIFKLLIWMVPIALLSGHYRYALIAYGLQRYEFLASVAAGVVSVVVGFLVIPHFGAHGAAVTLVAATMVNWVVAYIFAQRKIGGLSFMPHLIRPLMAGGGMVAIFMVLLPLNIWLAGAAAILLFGSSMLLSQSGLMEWLS